MRLGHQVLGEGCCSIIVSIYILENHVSPVVTYGQAPLGLLDQTVVAPGTMGNNDSLIKLSCVFWPGLK